MNIGSRVLCCLSLLTLACANKSSPADAGVPGAAKAPKLDQARQGQLTYGELLRIDFNFRAQELFLPLFWRTDANGDKTLQPEELAVLWGPQGNKLSDFVQGGAFTPKFDEAYRTMLTLADLSQLSPDELARRKAVKFELSQGMPTLVETDLEKAGPEELAMVDHLTRAAVLVEKLHALQCGTDAFASQLAGLDPQSRALFHRNQGPWCEAPKTENDPTCSALPGGAPKRVFGLYPADLQADPKFCEALSREPNGKELSGNHFAVVVKDGPGFKTVPYTEAWKEPMAEVAGQLEAAAAAIAPKKDEAALKSYLEAAAKAFRTNDWEPANSAWVAMGPENSAWYVRVAPDEVYYEPCAWKAGFALQLARINRESVAWQKKLEPFKGELERSLATLAGPPYKARKVAFKLPDFIDVVLNAGDQRAPQGATLGQSLPNWGPVAERGGRTVVMTNLYTDADSRKILEVQMASLFCTATMAKAASDPRAMIMSTVLHEAAHNLGPAHDYAVKGQKDRDVFGGPLASTMEELKAQTAALYFADWLADKKAITPEEAMQAHTRDVAWAFGHISRGMYDGTGRPKTYSQLSAVQLGWLLEHGGLAWHKDTKAANDADTGCFEIDFAKLRASVDALAKLVLQTKARGDKKVAQKLLADYVDGQGEFGQLRQEISKRWLSAPKATFVYSLRR